MNIPEYQKFIRELEVKLFPELEHDEIEAPFKFAASKACGYACPDRQNATFTPNQAFSQESPLLTEEIVHDLKENNKMLLSVGCGPAYLERLLVQGLGVNPEQIILADILPDIRPQGFKFVQFDMYMKWPVFEHNLDYIIFPDSTLLFAHGVPISGSEKLQENLLQRISYNAIQRLCDPNARPNPVGDIRIKNQYANVRRETAQNVADFLDKYFPGTKMLYTPKFIAYLRGKDGQIQANLQKTA